MIGRILCPGSGNPLTSPRSARYENGRAYRYPPPGKIYHYGIQDTAAIIADCDPRYGLLILDDYLIKELRAQVIPLEMAMQNEFDTNLHSGLDRARDLAGRWSGRFPSCDYGAILIKGELPTEEEIQRAISNRKLYAEQRLREVIKNQTLRLQGTRGMKAGYDPSDRAWAEEYGISLEGTLETMAEKHPLMPSPGDHSKQEPEDDRVPCPKCAEMIKPAALVCRYCETKFKVPVLEFITNPQQTQEARQ